MKDKILHFFVCAAIAIGCALLTHLLGLGVAAAATIGFWLAILAGVIKEFCDVAKDKDWSKFNWLDILADAIGAIAGFTIACLALKGEFDGDELLRYMFGCFILTIVCGGVSFPIVGSLAEYRTMLYPKYGWLWWLHLRDNTDNN